MFWFIYFYLLVSFIDYAYKVNVPLGGLEEADIEKKVSNRFEGSSTIYKIWKNWPNGVHIYSITKSIYFILVFNFIVRRSC